MKQQSQVRLSRWMLLPIAVLWSTHIIATPNFTAPGMNVIAGNQLVLPITVQNVDEPCAGLNATLSLPAGIICEASAKGVLTGSDGYWCVQGGGTGTVTIMIWSATDAFQASRGIVFELGMEVASNAVPGTYPLAFGRTGISNADGSESLPHSTGNGWLAIDVDTDGDGCGDQWETAQFNSLTNASDGSDADGDGLWDVGEFANNTNPRSIDTDGDGMQDNEEVVAGTNPLDPSDLLLATIDSDAGVSIEWDSVAARRYAILESSNLVSGVWTNIHQTWGHGSARAYTTTNLPSSSSFFKIQVVD